MLLNFFLILSFLWQVVYNVLLYNVVFDVTGGIKELNFFFSYMAQDEFLY